MMKRWFLIMVFVLTGAAAFSQAGTKDTTVHPVTDMSVIDTTIDYDELFRDFDAFMDSILTPRSYFLLSVSAGRSNYNFESKTNSTVTSVKKLTYSPLLGYFDKNGLGISANGYVVNDDKNLNLFQTGITASYDYLKNKNLATGFSYTKFFTKDSLPFYTTPLQNELYTYFTYRKWWLRPSLSASYGWGSRTDYAEREELITDLRLRRRGFTYINTTESVSDFSITASLRHDFYWLDIFSHKDFIRFTPQLAFTSGTQKFGFNQSSSTYVTVLRTGNNVLYNADNVYLDDQIKFQPLSLSFYLRSEYSLGKFFIQPQAIFDYYFPASSNNFNAVFSLNAGFIF